MYLYTRVRDMSVLYVSILTVFFGQVLRGALDAHMMMRGRRSIRVAETAPYYMLVCSSPLYPAMSPSSPLKTPTPHTVPCSVSANEAASVAAAAVTFGFRVLGFRV